MQILHYIVARCLHAIPVLIGVTIVVFLSIHLVPGDPIRIMMHGRIEEQRGSRRSITSSAWTGRWLLQYLAFIKNALR